MLEREFEFYLKNQNELVKKYNGRVVVIKEDDVIGVFDSEIDAIVETVKIHEMGSFLVQKCSEGDKDYPKGA